MASNGLALGKIGQISINGIRSLDKSIDFYREKLRLPFIAVFDPPGLAFFDCDGTHLMLTTEGEANNSTIRKATCTRFRKSVGVSRRRHQARIATMGSA